MYECNQINSNIGVAEHLNKDILSDHSGDESDDSDDSDKSPNIPDRTHSSFKPDNDIPKLFQSNLQDYKDSHFDRYNLTTPTLICRGHLAPCGDVKTTQTAMNETFLLTNISPQVGTGFNRGYWLQIESFVRRLVHEFDQVYVISGPLFLPRLNEDGNYYVNYQVLGSPPNTAVPTHFFKGFFLFEWS